MNLRKSIENEKELEFVVFCIESIAARMEVNAKRVYIALSVKSDILETYIIPEYEILHTQSKDYIVEDIMEVMREREVEV